MDSTIEKREDQLKLWEAQIHRLAVKTQMAGVQAGFDSLAYIDELKVLQAIAQAKFAEFRVGRETDRKRLKAEMKSAWKDLEAALQSPPGRR